MAKAVAKRKLRNSFYEKNTSIRNFDLPELENQSKEINGLYKRNGAKEFHKSKENKTELGLFERKKQELKYTVILQCISSIAIVVLICAIKFLKIDIVKNAEFTQKIIKEFNSSYPKEKMMEDAKVGINSFFNFVSPIIPDKISTSVIELVQKVFKGEHDIKTSSNKVDVYNEEINIYKEEQKEDKTNTNSEKDEQILVPVYSSISSQDEYIALIKKAGLKFTKPTSGTITSHFGAREEIFKGTESFHYGTDIANVKGTAIYSSIEGVVTVSSYDSELGKYIEVQNENIVTRYCHLSEQLVKVGEKVQNGDLIGKMGDTGLVTGVHLHFEIMYNRNRVDACKILELI
ncbi:MAG: M23 family metallopeptidase [Clostridia bacterium]|nr:M23 family metallopeptidase [Clostridia bacterium]MBR6504126.1 M23 family metallopeptidase [Clostridia bacterium]